MTDHDIRRRRFSIARLTWNLLAIVGGLVLLALLARSCTILYHETRYVSPPPPGGSLRIVRQITQGGFGTVWTTRVYVQDVASMDELLIYNNGDSDYVPRWRWESPERLVMLVPCGRVDHMSSPAAYAEADRPLGRVRIFYIYDAVRCAQPPKGDT